MKKLILILTTVISFGAVNAQQIPLYSTYYFNKFINNPAFAGFDNEYRFFGFYRSQWTSIPGAPATGGASFEGSFWKDRIGTGLMVVSDNTDIVKRITAQATYAQKIRFAKDHQISLGLSGGIFNVNIDYSKARITDLVDNTVLQNQQSKVMFDMSVGLTYSWKKLAIGFAVPQVLNSTAKLTSNLADAKYQIRRNYVASVQYEFNIKKELINITPSVLIRKATVGKVQVDAMCMFDYKHIAFVGAGYRSMYGVSVMAGAKIAKLFTVAYAYDINTNKKVKSYVGGTHEVIVGFSFGNNTKRLEDLEKKVKKMKENQDTLKANIDSVKAEVDTVKAKQFENPQPQIDEMKNRIDSLENKLREIKQMQEDFKERIGPKDGRLTGAVYELDQIYFDYRKWDLLPSSTVQLDKLVDALNRNPKMEIQIQGNTDNVGSNEYNQDLSMKRANTVVKYLVKKGISESRLAAIGMGEDNPVATNDTDAGRQKNRRVEFVVMKE